MGRTNPLALRMRGILNWPSNVRHPLLSSYIKHVFQATLASEPAVRASTSGIWVNVTVLASPALFKPPSNPSPSRSPSSPSDTPSTTTQQQQKQHPLLTSPPAALDLRNADPLAALGPIDRRVTKAASQHLYFRNVFKKHAKNAAQALDARDDPLQALQIYRDTPIHVKVNVITNPLLNAQVCAAFVARELGNNKSMPRVYKGLLGKM